MGDKKQPSSSKELNTLQQAKRKVSLKIGNSELNLSPFYFFLNKKCNLGAKERAGEIKEDKRLQKTQKYCIITREMIQKDTRQSAELG